MALFNIGTNLRRRINTSFVLLFLLFLMLINNFFLGYCLIIIGVFSIIEFIGMICIILVIGTIGSIWIIRSIAMLGILRHWKSLICSMSFPSVLLGWLAGWMGGCRAWLAGGWMDGRLAWLAVGSWKRRMHMSINASYLSVSLSFSLSIYIWNQQMYT